MDYDEMITLLSREDFFALFSSFKVEPRWVMSAGKKAIQIIGKCHHGHNHSALFDPSTLKVNCFSECGRGMHLHTWFKQALELDDPRDAKEFIEYWINNQKIDFTNRIPRKDLNFKYQERPYKIEDIEPIKGIDKEILKKYLNRFDNSLDTLKNLVWHTQDGINVDILLLYEVYYYPDNKTIILPHHNINGEIVGLYERNFRELRKIVRKQHPDMPFKTDILMKDNEGYLKRQAQLIDYPRAKYVPLLRDEIDREDRKNSWSFPNSSNLYGFHLALESIKKTKKAIVFEGGKSVMLAHQYGYNNCVATHTFGIHFNHISMLINAGAEEIVLAFDKQYNEQIGRDWDLYEKKTKEIAIKVGKYVKISRIIDGTDFNETPKYLNFKDSPIDRGATIFEILLHKREILTEQVETKENLGVDLYEIESKLQEAFSYENINDNIEYHDLMKKELLALLAKRVKERNEREGK